MTVFLFGELENLESLEKIEKLDPLDVRDELMDGRIANLEYKTVPKLTRQLFTLPYNIHTGEIHTYLDFVFEFSWVAFLVPFSGIIQTAASRICIKSAEHGTTKLTLTPEGLNVNLECWKLKRIKGSSRNCINLTVKLWKIQTLMIISNFLILTQKFLNQASNR